MFFNWLKPSVHFGKGIKICLFSLLALTLASTLPVLALRWVNPPTTSFMLQYAWTAAGQSGEGVSVEYQWADYDEISRHMLLAAVSAEDQKFPLHFGFDLEAIQKAIEHNREGGRLLGASTITQQTAKNLFLWPGRSLFRKGLEAYFTALMELMWSKRRILEMYVNIAQMGDGIFGVQAASRAYFDKPAAELTRGQSALLAAVLPNPVRYSVRNPSSYVLRRKQWILRHMRLLGGPRYLDGL